MCQKSISSEVNAPSNNIHMVQYGVWPDCTNNCDFCLRKNRKSYTKQQKIFWLKQIRNNIKNIDWKTQFSHGVSLLGGELFYIKDEAIQKVFMSLIDTIIEYVLIPGGENCKFSTVTNGIYEPSFLYKVVDRIVDRVGIQRVDVNFSYDLKYRYHSERSRLLAYNNINAFHKRYNYDLGIQMILTQYVINLWKQGEFDVQEFIDSNFPGCHLAFLYPHPINTKMRDKLDDFFFNRRDFLLFVQYLKSSHYSTYINFVNSTKNSATYKYTGLRDRVNTMNLDIQTPKLSDGKEEISSCGHSMLYRCYADSDKCVLCDLMLIDSEL